MRFVKQYYNTISTSPEQIVRFYQPALSALSVGRSNCDSTAVLHEAAAARFSGAFDGSDASVENSIRFEFERGAIDAQASVNNAILVVATGSVVLSHPENGSSGKEREKAFVHTFFLGSLMSGTKRSYYIHNDILRFLEEPEVTAVETSTSIDTAVAKETGMQEEKDLVTTKKSKSVTGPVADAGFTTLAEETTVVAPHVPIDSSNVPIIAEDTVQVDEPPAVVRTASTSDQDKTRPSATTKSSATATASTKLDDKITTSARTTSTIRTNDEAPGRGVEETKEAILADEESTPKSKAAIPAAKPNWASVARAQTTAPTPPATPVRSVTTDKDSNINSHKAANTPKSGGVGTEASPNAAPGKSNTISPAAAPAPTSTKPQSKSSSVPRIASKQRDPECTLVIKNIGTDTVEGDIRALFEPFATSTQTKIVGCTVSGSRGIAFVDYDSVEPVVKAVDQQSIEAFYVRERKLEIYQKTAEQRPRISVRGGGRGSDGIGHSGKGSGGRGRDYRRKNSGSGGRGDRGGGVGGRSGGRDGASRGRGGGGAGGQ